MVCHHPTLKNFVGMLVGWICCAALGCGDGDEPAPIAPQETPDCRIDSQCLASERCDEGVCTTRPPCEGDGCPCLLDGDCAINAICDVFTGLCIETGCDSPRDCPMGETCTARVCTPIPEVLDRDDDGVLDDTDNCADIPNEDQADADNDGVGDVCERDFDGDGAIDDLDNCPQVPNPDQLDEDMDGEGDACEPEPVLEGRIALSLTFAELWIPESERRAEVLLTSGEQRVRREIIEGEPVTIEGLSPGMWIARLDRPGFSPDVAAITVEVDQTAEVVLEASLSDLVDAGMDLRGVVLDREILAALVEAGVSMRGADLTEVALEGVLDDLALDLSEAILVDGALDGVVLDGARLVQADLSGVSMAGAGMVGVELTGARLVGIQGSGADLSGATLDAVDATDAALIRVDLSGASLVGATFEGANLTGATFSDDTICPDGRPQAEFVGCGLQ